MEPEQNDQNESKQEKIKKLKNGHSQTKHRGQSKQTLKQKMDVEKIVDLIRWDDRGEVQCLIKYKGITTPEWVSLDDVKKCYPLLLIDYYETRIILRKQQCQMAFERTNAATRKLVVIS